jgi:peroxiredoxin
MLGLLILIAPYQGPTIILKGDADAKAVEAAMTDEYKRLNTLKCLVIDRSANWRVQRANFVFRRPGDLFLQRLDPKKEGVYAESRYRDGEVTMSTPQEPDRYFRTKVAGNQPWMTPLLDLSNRTMMRLSELALLLDPGRWGAGVTDVATLRLLPPVTTDEGVLTDVLEEDHQSSWVQGGKAAGWHSRATYEVGRKDHLIRQIKSESLGENGPNLNALIDFRDVHADQPVSDALFEFKPPKGSHLVTEVPRRSAPEPAMVEFSHQVSQAYAALKSLSMRVEWLSSGGAWDQNGNPISDTSRITLSYELQKPLQGKLSFEMEASYAHQNLYAVSDGKFVYSRVGKETDYLKVPAKAASDVAWFGHRGIPLGAGGESMQIAERFFEPDARRFPLASPVYHYVGPATYHGEAVIEVDPQSNGFDEYGIPTDPGVRHDFYGRDDKLWRGSEEESVARYKGRVSRHTVSEAVVRLQADPVFNTTLFTFDPSAGRGFGSQQEADLANGIRSVQALTVGDSPLALPGKTLDGRDFSIKELKGKVVLIDAYTYGCYPCRRSMLEHAKLVAKYRDQGLAMLGLPLDDESGRATLTKFVAEQKLDWPQLFDGKGWMSPIVNQFGIQSVPFVVVLGRDGRVVLVDPSETDLPRLVQAELGKPLR